MSLKKWFYLFLSILNYKTKYNNEIDNIIIEIFHKDFNEPSKYDTVWCEGNTRLKRLMYF